jgi:hypothetical protein
LLPWQTTAAVAAASTYNILQASHGTSPYFIVRGDGLTTAHTDLTIGSSAADTLTVTSTLFGATPLVFEGATYVKPRRCIRVCAVVSTMCVSFLCRRFLHVVAVAVAVVVST